jgi:Family of unknown function (DUF6506)
MTGRQIFLFLEPGSDPRHDRTIVNSDGVETLMAWVPDPVSAAEVAAAEADLGAGIVELYRGFGLDAVTGVLNAVHDRAAVGFATYPHGVRPPGRIHRSATIFRSGPGPHEPIIRRHPGGGSTVVVGSPDTEATVALARRFVEDGVDLVEICGGEPLATAARVHAVLGDRAPVSYVVYPYDSLDRAAAYKASFAVVD